MKLKVKNLKETIENHLNEVGNIKKSLAALATTTALMSSPSAQAQNVSTSSVSQQKEKPKKISKREIIRIIKRASQKYNVPANLIYAMVQTESAFRPYAVSSAGAVGLMQIIPSTGEWLGVEDLNDPEQNIMGGTKFIKYLLRRFDGDLEKAVAAYNAGPSAVIRHKGIPPYKETQKYVKKVIERMETSPLN